LANQSANILLVLRAGFTQLFHNVRAIWMPSKTTWCNKQQQEDAMKVCDVITYKDHSRRESEGFVWLQLRAPLFTVGIIYATTFGNFETIRVVSSQHTPQRKASHYWPTLHCTHQLWYKHGVSRQSANYRGRKAYTYATFIEARMVAALGAPRHSTNNRISFLDQDARGWNCIRLHSLQNGYCLSTTNR